MVNTISAKKNHHTKLSVTLENTSSLALKDERLETRRRE